MSNQAMIGVLAYGLAINLVAYAAMVMDKAKAENRVRRIPEATLLRLALLGGSVGTVLAQQTMRHKTRKEPFRSKLIGILVLQIVVLIALTVALVVAGSPEALWRLLTL
ncbi:DUF1294 domain-containing protein [Aureimonas sp. AU12]|uniref:DUF1294 domain-containing protein n=1 Tax=Aureimonas sp. AU12 TaxID=1638161 RepID=UPI0009EC5369|nr:DUF1294 domain-containing protein [Aureimonas sp. AU12]